MASRELSEQNREREGGVEDSVFARAVRVLTAPAHWVAMGAAGSVLVLTGAGLIGSVGVAVAAAAYVGGWAIGGMWLGIPWRAEDSWQALEFKDEGDVRQSMSTALAGVRALVNHNPDGKISHGLQRRVLQLCDSLEDLLRQWERSRGDLTLTDSFDARRIATEHLPQALNTYLRIPAKHVSAMRMANGQTPEQAFEAAVSDLQTRVEQLASDLARQDAKAFLDHTTFLNQKFGAPASSPLRLDGGERPHRASDATNSIPNQGQSSP